MKDNDYELYHALGEPIPFKKKLIYPSTINDIKNGFFELLSVITIDKNSIEEEEIMRMSYLTFLLTLASTESGIKNGLLDKILRLMSFVFKTDKVDFSIEKGISYIHIDDKKFNQMDFDKIRKIIYEQNLVEFDDDFMESSNRKALEEARAFMRKHNKEKTATLGQEITAYHCELKVGYEEIKKLTLYQFREGLTRANHIKESDIINTARMSGMVKFDNNNDIPHWLGLIKKVNSDDMLKMSEAEFAKIAESIQT